MNNKLIIHHPNLPLRAYPKGTLKTILEGDFLIWISDLLGLTGEESAKRLFNAIPAIEKHFWSLGIEEIQKAFIMYADGELITKPIPNYFTRILVGQIFKEYKQQKPVVKKEIKMPEPTQEEKELIIYTGLIFCFDNWVQTKEIINGQVWIHDHLMELGLLDFTNDQKNTMWINAKINLEAHSKNLPYEEAKELMREISSGRKSSSREIEYKKLRVKRYFANIHVKGKHLSEFI